MRNIKLVLNFVFVALAMSFFVSAYGVSSPYWDDNPLIMAPGESRLVTLNLQNMVGGEDVSFSVDLGNSEIASLADSTESYFVPLGVKDVPVNILVSVPSGAQVGRKYDVGVTFHKVSNDEGQMVQMSAAISKSFPVIIQQATISTDGGVTSSESPQIEQAESSGMSSGFLIVLVVVVLALVIFFFRKNTSKKNIIKKK